MMTMLHFVVFGALIYLQGVFMGDYNSSYYLGTHIDLECESQTPVDCIWNINELAVYIGDHYQYIFSNGTATTDCSIQIPEFQEGDVGNWTCWSLGTDEIDGQLLNSYQLTSNDHWMENKDSSRFTIAVRQRMAVILDCKFDVNLEECHWFRNNEPVAILNRYKYINFNQTGHDCSINITTFKAIDYGTWQCTTSANTIYGYRTSHVAWLISQQINDGPISIYLPTKSHNSVIEHPPEEIYSKLGDTVIIPCSFKDPVYCVWLRNDRPIHVGHHYQYTANITTGSRASNCTLAIFNLLLDDIGQWICVGAGHDAGYAIKSNSVSLMEKEEYAWTFNSDGEDYAYPGDNETLYCSLGRSAYCDWKRNGVPVQINNRYSFSHDKDGIGLKSRLTCSIEISPVKYLDAGNWSCSIMQIRAKKNSTPKAKTLTLHVLSRPVLQINNITLSKYGKSIALEDLKNENNTLLCTVETRNYSPKLNWKFRGKIYPGVYKEVKTEENNYLGKLYWEANNTIDFYTTYGSSYDTTYRKWLDCEYHVSRFRKESASIEVLRRTSVKNQQELMQTSYMASKIYPMLGDKIQLDCTFNKPVNCSWKMNNTHVTNSSLYQYIDTFGGRDTTNCSILVNYTVTMMNSTWQCENMIIYTNESAKSYPSTFTKMKTPTKPLIKMRYKTVDKILFPLLENIYENYEFSSYLQCSTIDVVPRTRMHWEANGVVISESPSNSLPFYSSDFRALTKLKNATHLKCVMSHPTLNSPKYTTLELERYMVPFHPILKINGAMRKENVTLQINDKRNEIICVCQNGYPSANLYWNLDGQKLSQDVNRVKVANFQYTSALQWQPPIWKMFKKTMQLNCVAEHPGWDNPEVALATITFVYNITKDQLQLLNEDRVMHIQDKFVFQCISSHPINCSMMLNNTIVKEIAPVATVPSNDLIEGHIIEHCNIEISSFGMKHVGSWQCTNGLANEGLIKSNEVILTPFDIPLKPRIEVEKSNGYYYMNENSDEIIMKNADAKLKLTCVVQGSNPKSTLRWILNGNNLESIRNITTIKTNYYQHESILRWDSAVNFTQADTSAVLKCVVFFPTSEISYKTTEIRISKEARPGKPVILFNDKIVTRKVDVPVPSDFNGFKCISEKGNPAPKLSWKVNGQGISGQYEKRIVDNNGYTVTLVWNSKMNDHLAEGPLSLSCVATHPSLISPITNGIQVTIKSRTGVSTRTPETVPGNLPDQTETTALYYFIIALISAFAIIVTILTVVIYVRMKIKRSSGDSSNMVFSWLCSYFGRKQTSKDSPLIKYYHCEGESECQATIISTGSKSELPSENCKMNVY